MPSDLRSFALLLLLIVCGCSRKSTQAPDSLSPEKSLQTFRLSEDFHVELFAGEPDVVDPVDMAFDENGRIYVAEMIDYPDDPPPGKPPRSRIVLLEDRDGDGRIDHWSVFADHLLEVSGLMPWKGGLIVTTAPEILYLKDTHGDGKADVRQVLYTGFRLQNPQHRIANPRLGIDNWIYVANDGAAGQITSPEHPERAPISVRGADFRFQPVRDLAEPASGPTQFGLSFNDWGDRFATSNTFHLHHMVVPMRYLMHSSALPVPAVSQYLYPRTEGALRVFQLTPPQLWRQERTRVRQQRYQENGSGRVEQLAGYFTAASGGTVYTGDAFPPEYVGDVFTGEVAGNLVRHDKLTSTGATFTAHPARDGVEFLASTDVWFRPCNFTNAPDGNLYMLDFYREVIESPEYIPDAIKRFIDFHHGDDKGRIYRIVPNHPRRRGDLKVRLGSASIPELVKQLESTNGWNRETAHRLLLERQDRSAAPLLADLAQRRASPQARLQALWTLEGIGGLTPELVMSALRDPEPHVREHALRLAEEFLPEHKDVAAAALALDRDTEPRVRFQLALTLNKIEGPRALDVLAALATNGGASDHWLGIAILNSAADRPFQFFERLSPRDHGWQAPAFLTQLGALIGAKHDRREMTALISELPRLDHPEAGLAGLANGLKLVGARNLQSPESEAGLARLIANSNDAVKKAAWGVASHFELQVLWPTAIREAQSSELPPPRRASVIQALRGGRSAQVQPVLRAVLESNPPPEVQRAVVETMASCDDPATGPTLLSYWRAYQPPARAAALEALFGTRERASLLLDAIEQRQIPAASLEAAARNRLLEYPDPQLSARAKALLRTAGGDRAKVVVSYRDVLNLRGDAGRGRQVLEKNCGRCHLSRRGRDQVGPDLSGVNNKTKEELLTSILNPSAAIEPRFINYLITTKDGRLHDGVIGSETPGMITLRNGSEDGDDLILRSNIVEMRASSVSIMPEDLEQSLSRQDLADVIAYLRGGT
jgi:putative membrane-bound dehydrogenase-like protein